MFLMFRLGRPTCYRFTTWACRKGYALTYGKQFLPKPRDLTAFGERWRPYRSIASWYMWRAVEHYGKKRKVTKEPPKKRRKKPLQKLAQRSAPTRRPKKRAR